VFGSNHISSIIALQNLSRTYVEIQGHDIAAKIFTKVIELRNANDDVNDEIELI